MLMRVIVAGGRDFEDYQLLKRTACKLLTKYHPEEVTIISGCAMGADSLGEELARDMGYGVRAHPANWERYGKSAGYRRNAEMADVATHLLAFWDGKSKGTKHMIDLATKKGLTIKIVRY
jgi:hypothetical protein